MKFTLPSFIRLCMINSSEKIPLIQKKFAATGGYDYYWTLNKAILAKVDRRTDDEINDILLSVKNLSERSYNLKAYETFSKRFSGKQLQIFDNTLVYSLFGKVIEISISPNFGYIDEDGSHAVVVWAAQYPKLTKPYAAVACHLMRIAYEGTKSSNNTFHFCDLVSNRDYSEKIVTNKTKAMLQVEANNIATIISMVEAE